MAVDLEQHDAEVGAPSNGVQADGAGVGKDDDAAGDCFTREMRRSCRWSATPSRMSRCPRSTVRLIP